MWLGQGGQLNGAVSLTSSLCEGDRVLEVWGESGERKCKWEKMLNGVNIVPQRKGK